LSLARIRYLLAMDLNAVALVVARQLMPAAGAGIGIVTALIPEMECQAFASPRN